MIDIGQFRLLVVRPVLTHLQLWSTAAENLLIGTALQESGLRFLHQRGGGPARGLYQIEPDSENDLHVNFLAYRPPLAARLYGLVAPVPSRTEQLATNLAYATAVARLIYYRCPEPLPAAGDIAGMARYWKFHFNTEKGKGSIPAFILNYKEFIA
jgi:hypothetical protein